MSGFIPNVLVFGHSFVRRLNDDLNNGFDSRAKQNFNLANEPIPECAKHHGSLVTQQNFSTWRLYFSNEVRC